MVEEQISTHFCVWYFHGSLGVRLSLEEERDTLSAQCVRSRTKVIELQGLFQNAKEGTVECDSICVMIALLLFCFCLGCTE